MKKTGKTIIKSFILLQIAVVIYSLSTVCGKKASGNDLLSAAFILWFGADIALMGVYALIWQQVIKVLDLSIAYANKSVTLLWTLLFSVLLFSDEVTAGKALGVILAIAGTVIMNTGSGKKETAGEKEADCEKAAEGERT